MAARNLRHPFHHRGNDHKKAFRQPLIKVRGFSTAESNPRPTGQDAYQGHTFHIIRYAAVCTPSVCASAGLAPRAPRGGRGGSGRLAPRAPGRLGQPCAWSGVRLWGARHANPPGGLPGPFRRQIRPRLHCPGGMGTVLSTNVRTRRSRRGLAHVTARRARRIGARPGARAGRLFSRKQPTPGEAGQDPRPCGSCAPAAAAAACRERGPSRRPHHPCCPCCTGNATEKLGRVGSVDTRRS